MSTIEKPVVKARIKIGTRIAQDFQAFAWPECLPTLAHYHGSDFIYDKRVLTPNMLFTCTLGPKGWDCVAPGFGERMDYGNGSILIVDINGIELVGDENVIPLANLTTDDVYTIQVTTDKFTYVVQMDKHTVELKHSYIVGGDNLIPVEIDTAVMRVVTTHLMHNSTGVTHINLRQGAEISLCYDKDGYWMYAKGMNGFIKIDTAHYEAVEFEGDEVRLTPYLMQVIITALWGREYKVYL
jgi:hypothetical protein